MILATFYIVLYLFLETTPVQSRQYMVIGVSGGLQDGFPDHTKMDYHSKDDSEVVQAVFLGRALARGCKAFLDVMQEGWRQYSPEPQQPLINSVVLVSGCHEHGNQYWLYAADTRQVLFILNNEPRFLSISPDTALIDLVTNETFPAVKALALHEIQRQGKADESVVAFPIVLSTWYNPSFVPSPVIRTGADGTLITNFPESLALWANVNDEDRTAGCDAGQETCPSEDAIAEVKQRYWDGIRKAVRTAEVDRLPTDQWRAQGPPFDCQRPARLGVSLDQARVNYAFDPSELQAIFDKAGFILDYDKAELRMKDDAAIK